MNGSIAQIVALTCYGNAYLQGHNTPQFFHANSTCQFCDRVTFVETVKPWPGKQREDEVAGDPDRWFSYLKAKGARGIHLSRTAQNDPQISDRMASAFVGGGGTWCMEVQLPKNQSEFWIARWEVWNQKAPERRIWRVTYGRVGEATSNSHQYQRLSTAEGRLLKALRAIHTFSEKHNCGGFTNSFAKGIAAVTQSERHGYHKDLSPAGFLSGKAEAILDASQSAWVFGGMGSWNDMGFDGADGKEYERVSEELFQSIQDAICVAANSVSK